MAEMVQGKLSFCNFNIQMHVLHNPFSYSFYKIAFSYFFFF